MPGNISDGSSEAEFSRAISEINSTGDASIMRIHGNLFPLDGETLTGNLTILGQNNRISLNSGQSGKRFLFVDGGTLNIQDLTLTGWDSGGGDGGTLFINNSNANLNDVTINGSEGDDAGAIVVQDSNATITDSTFTDNQATDGAFGVIWIRANSNLSIFNSTFTNNSATTGGGAVGINQDTSSLRIENSTFTNNRAGTNGGAIWISRQPSVDIINTTFDGNVANYGNGSVTSGTINVSDGGAVYIGSGNVTFTDSVFTGNSGYHGGAIMIHESTDQVTITGGVLSGNNSRIGGAIYNYQGEAVDDKKIRIWIMPSTKRELENVIGNLEKIDLSQIIMKIANSDLEISPASSLGYELAVPLEISKSAYQSLKENFDGVSDEHIIRLLIQYLREKV